MGNKIDVIGVMKIAASVASNAGANGTHDALVEARYAVAALLKAAREAQSYIGGEVWDMPADHPGRKLIEALARFGGSA